VIRTSAARTGTHFEPRELPQETPLASPYPQFTLPMRIHQTTGAPVDPSDPGSHGDHGGGGDSDGPDSDADDPATNRAFLSGTISSHKKTMPKSKKQSVSAQRGMSGGGGHTYGGGGRSNGGGIGGVNGEQSPGGVDSQGGQRPYRGTPALRVFGNPSYWSRYYDNDNNEKDQTKARTGINYRSNGMRRSNRSQPMSDSSITFANHTTLGIYFILHL
jgi:hypothetical protein